MTRPQIIFQLFLLVDIGKQSVKAGAADTVNLSVTHVAVIYSSVYLKGYETILKAELKEYFNFYTVDRCPKISQGL